jgi:hypothetical protein
MNEEILKWDDEDQINLSLYLNDEVIESENPAESSCIS